MTDHEVLTTPSAYPPLPITHKPASHASNQQFAAPNSKQTPLNMSSQITPGTALSSTPFSPPPSSVLAALTTPVPKPTPLPEPSTADPFSVLVPSIKPSTAGAKPLSKSYSMNLARSIRHRWLGTVGYQQNYYYERKMFEEHKSNQCNNMYLQDVEKNQDSTFRHRVQTALDDYGMLPAQLEYLLKLDKKQSKIFRSWYSHEICLPPAGPFGNPEKARVIDLVEKFVNNFEQKSAAFFEESSSSSPPPPPTPTANPSENAIAEACYILCTAVDNSATPLLDLATSNRTQSTPITMFPFGYITRPSEFEDLGRQETRFEAMYRPIDGGTCKRIRSKSTFQQCVESLKAAERTEILDLAKNDKDKEVLLRSGKLLDMKCCWDKQKDMWRIGVGYDNGAELRNYRKMYEEQHPELVTNRESQTQSQPDDDEDLFGDGLDSPEKTEAGAGADAPPAPPNPDEGYVASPPQKERAHPKLTKPNSDSESSDSDSDSEAQDTKTKPKPPRRRRFGTPSTKPTESLDSLTSAPRPQRSTLAVKFENIREEVKSAMKEFGEIGIEDVCIILGIDEATEGSRGNQRDDARKFFHQNCNDNTMRNHNIATKLDTWAKCLNERNFGTTKLHESLKEDKNTHIPGSQPRTYIQPMAQVQQAYSPKYQEGFYDSDEEPDYIYKAKSSKIKESEWDTPKQQEKNKKRSKRAKDKKIFEKLRKEKEAAKEHELSLMKQRQKEQADSIARKRKERKDQINKEKMRKNPSILSASQDSLMGMGTPSPPLQRTTKRAKKAVPKPNPKATNKTKAKPTKAKSAETKPSSLFNQSIFSPVKGKRKIKRPQVFDPLSTTTSNVIIGTGFGCPMCGSGMAYDEKKCKKCGADTYYVPGVGAVVGHDRNATPLPQSIVPKKAAPRKRKPAPKKKVVVVQEVESESSEGSDFDSSDSSSDDEPAPKRAPRRRAGFGLEHQRFMKSFKQLPRNKISREEFIPTQTQDADSDDEEYRAEMKLYRKGLSDRKVLQIRERKEVNEYKEECERKEANELFFRQGAPRSEESKRREEKLNKFVRTKSFSGRLQANKHCSDAKNCRFCNNYWGEEINEFDCEVEPTSAMPTFRVVKSVTEEPTSRKRRLAEANFVLIYNKKLFAKGEAEGGFDELEELVAEKAEENAVATHNTTNNKRRRR